MGVRFVLLVDSHGTLHMNPEMRDRIKLINAETDLAISPPLDPTAAESALAPAEGVGGR